MRLARLHSIHYKAMALRQQGLTYQEIANRLGKSRRAISSWFNESELFKEEFRKREAQAKETAINTLLDYGVEAAKNLVKIAEGKPASKTQLEAIKDILDRIGIKAPETKEIKSSGSQRIMIVDDIRD